MGTKCSKCLAKDDYPTNKKQSLIELPSHIENSLKDSILQLSSDYSFLTFDKILNKHPNNPDILISFASQLYEKGLTIQANECFKYLLERDFQLSPKGSVIYAQILIQNKNYDLAFKILIQNLDNVSNDHETHALLAELYAKLDKHNQSYKHISEAIKLNDNIAEYHNSYGLCMMKKKEYNDALKHFLRAYDLDNNMAKALNNAGNAYRKLGSIAEAIKCYNLAINLIPKRKFPIALINIATICFYTGDILSMLQYFEEALQTGCNIHKIMVKKGYHLLFKNPKTKFAIELFHKQEYRKSIVLFNEILQKDPYNTIVNYYMAISLTEINKNLEANDYYKATIENGLKPICAGKKFIRHYVKLAVKALNKQIPKTNIKTCEEIPEVDEDSENSTINIGAVEVFKVRAESLSKPYQPRSQESPTDSPIDTSIEESEEKCLVM
ncbi:hypothetical protein SteCoe_23174 [Stentor coeruleus]|uniref:Uncharacterized protein n=1 Tax=Stentor coeruleus TaxID=5963 RepID=A0A1R2BL48_9CILI|nr:hypothetical protein SteCoe_24712 [Stentor coeruleus]OMJ77265.1 hypothetical protein SteCoe_23174 [Stentor coeruleus]